MADEVRLAGVRVLIVEDDALAALFARGMLEELGCVAAGVARSVAEALEAVGRAESLDCVMLDVRLGQDLSSEIATELIKKDVPFIICSGYDIKLPGLDIPVVDKPYTIQILGNALRQALSRPR